MSKLLASKELTKWLKTMLAVLLAATVITFTPSAMAESEGTTSDIKLTDLAFEGNGKTLVFEVENSDPVVFPSVLFGTYSVENAEPVTENINVISWDCVNDYTENSVRIYEYQPVVELGYDVSEVILPIFTVKDSRIEINSFELSDTVKNQTFKNGTSADAVVLPTSVNVTNADGQTETLTYPKVTWALPEGVNFDGATGGSFVYTMQLPEGYRLAEGVELPTISVYVKTAEDPKELTMTISDFEFWYKDLVDGVGEYKQITPDMEDKPVLKENSSVKLEYKWSISAANGVYKAGDYAYFDFLKTGFPVETFGTNAPFEVKDTVTGLVIATYEIENGEFKVTLTENAANTASIGGTVFVETFIKVSKNKEDVVVKNPFNDDNDYVFIFQEPRETDETSLRVVAGENNNKYSYDTINWVAYANEVLGNPTSSIVDLEIDDAKNLKHNFSSESEYYVVYGYTNGVKNEYPLNPDSYTIQVADNGKSVKIDLKDVKFKAYCIEFKTIPAYSNVKGKYIIKGSFNNVGPLQAIVEGLNTSVITKWRSFKYVSNTGNGKAYITWYSDINKLGTWIGEKTDTHYYIKDTFRKEGESVDNNLTLDQVDIQLYMTKFNPEDGTVSYLDANGNTVSKREDADEIWNSSMLKSIETVDGKTTFIIEVKNQPEGYGYKIYYKTYLDELYLGNVVDDVLQPDAYKNIISYGPKNGKDTDYVKSSEINITVNHSETNISFEKKLRYSQSFSVAGDLVTGTAPWSITFTSKNHKVKDIVITDNLVKDVKCSADPSCSVFITKAQQNSLYVDEYINGVYNKKIEKGVDYTIQYTSGGKVVTDENEKVDGFIITIPKTVQYASYVVYYSSSHTQSVAADGSWEGLTHNNVYSVEFNNLSSGKKESIKDKVVEYKTGNPKDTVNPTAPEQNKNIFKTGVDNIASKGYIEWTITANWNNADLGIKENGVFTDGFSIIDNIPDTLELLDDEVVVKIRDKGVKGAWNKEDGYKVAQKDVDYKLTYKNNQLVVEVLKEHANAAVQITLKTKIKGFIENVQNIHVFENKAIQSATNPDIKDIEYKASVTVKEINYLNKVGVSQVDKHGRFTGVINWEVSLNEANAVLNDVVITDSMSAGHIYEDGSLKVYKGTELVTDDNYELSVVVDSQKQTKITVTFNKDYKMDARHTLKYNTEIDYAFIEFNPNTNKPEVRNSVTLSALGEEVKTVEKTITEKWTNVSGVATAKRIPLAIYKLESNTSDVYLQGAVFELRDADKNAIVIKGITDENGRVTTDENGYAYFGELLMGTYYLYEVTAPNGYTFDGDDRETTVVLDEKSVSINDKGEVKEVVVNIYNKVKTTTPDPKPTPTTNPTSTPPTVTPTPTPPGRVTPTPTPTPEVPTPTPSPLPSPTSTPEGIQIDEDETPEAAGIGCWIHWLMLLVTLVYSLYSGIRVNTRKKDNEELEDELYELKVVEEGAE